MAKKDDMKIRLLAIERILKVGQVITSSEIIKELEGRFGITADRKTIYDDIRAISRIVPVECVSGKGGGYKLLNVLVETEQIPFDGSGYVGAVAMNDVFGFANLRQDRLREAVRENTARYAKEGEGFLLEYMEKIGFKVEGNRVLAFVDDDGEPVPVGRALKEGYLNG